MGAEEALEFVDNLVFISTGEHLHKAQRIILRHLWEDEKRTYHDIAVSRGYTEAHLKAVGAQLWHLLSNVLGEKVSKSNFSRVVQEFCTSQQGQNSCQRSYLGFNHAKLQDLDSNFVGRDREIAELQNLVSQGTKIIFIQGEGGVGKTTLARKYLKTQGFSFLELWMAQESQNIVSAESVVEEWLRKDFHEEPGREFGINLDRLRRKLRNGFRKIGVLIDGLESALDRNGQIINSHRSYVELLRVLADSTIHSVTLIASRERLYESGFNVNFYSLEGLDESAWREFFARRQINSQTNALSEMCQAFGGNAKAMEIISGAIIRDFDRNADIYWRENKNDLLVEGVLEHLVNSQFDRLAKMDAEAYRLLCRLGCYRYQNVTHVNIKGLQCLLWDIPEPLSRRIIKSLCDRSLVEFRKGKYWLHPVICTKAIARLRASGEWQIANRKAAEFWTATVSKIEATQDALMALEAYYHYVEIGEFEQAANVILGNRANRWDNSISLGVLFYRFGLLETLISVITHLIDNLNSEYYLSKLYNMLGRAYHQIGNIALALDCHERANQIAQIYNIFPEKISSNFNIGLCYIDLWELEQAKNIFYLVKNLSEADENYYQYVVYSLCCLAYLNSSLGLIEDAVAMLRDAEAGMTSERLTSWGRGTSLLYISLTYKNLGYIETAFDICHQAIAHCEINQFTSLKARATSCLASLHREQGQFIVAINKHLDAIVNMTTLSDKCNLAKAYYQLALTYQRMGEVTISRDTFNRAIFIFDEIQAPKQVQKLQTAIARLEKS
ncbi:MAG: AAA family ATPase [Aulosira sp. ZfuVER01]|nr:ATP-binding protein [Aulosira sp. ZfuVER01]MDZ7997777.1 ATP-binding protein [Aulosira sp. DedVER01a]MDZ8052272.1 ATP-binding protein [Aulosira sp. ZfuCHP01]